MWVRLPYILKSGIYNAFVEAGLYRDIGEITPNEFGGKILHFHATIGIENIIIPCIFGSKFNLGSNHCYIKL